MARRKVTIILFIIILLAGAFLAQVGIYYYKIKSGKIDPSSFSKNFTAAKSSSATTTISAAEILDGTAPWYGAENPELTIVEFGNFACPNSQEVSATAREIMIKNKDKIKFIYRDFPLDDIYPNSSYLSLLGKCAGEQGKFWAMHDKLYQSPKSDPLVLIKQVGLNEKSFADCLSKQKSRIALQKDFSDGYKNGVAGTPTFFFIKKGLEDKPLAIPGAIPKDIFEKIVDTLLK